MGAFMCFIHRSKFIIQINDIIIITTSNNYNYTNYNNHNKQDEKNLINTQSS